MKNWILILFTGLLFCSCAGQEKVEFELHIPKHKPSDLIVQLDSAFITQNSTQLDDFFKTWNLEIQPNNAKITNQNEVIKAVYDIYKAFYSPDNPTQLVNWESFHIPRANLAYYVIQNMIYYSVMSDFEIFQFETSKIDSIINFKPQLEQLGQERILYLTDEYDSALNGFLGSEHHKFGTGNIMSPAYAKGESEKRYKFLKKHLHILHGHWGGYYHLETHPIVGVVVMNKQLSKAKVHFRYGYEGGETTLRKENGKWEIQSSKTTWIE